MPGFMGRLGGLFGGDQPPSALMGSPQVNPAQDGRLAAAAALLQGSGGGSNFAEIMGKALMASRQARLQTQEFQSQREAQESEGALRRVQIEKLQNPDPTVLGRGAQMRDASGNLLAENTMTFGNTGSGGALMSAYATHVQQAEAAGIEPKSIDEFLPFYTDRTTKMVPRVATVAEVPTVVTPQRGGGVANATPLTNIGTVVGNAGAVQEAQAAGGVAGKERETRFWEAPAAKVKVDGFVALNNETMQKIGRVRDDPALWRATGIAGLIPSIWGGAAADIDASIETLAVTFGFDRLQEMRNNSPNGSSLGNVSNIEGAWLQNSLQSLKQSQSRGQYVNNLNLILSHMKGVNDRLLKAYEADYTPRTRGRPTPGAPTADDGWGEMQVFR